MSKTAQSRPWDQLSPYEKVEALRREFDDLVRIERNNVDARAVLHKEIETRMARVEEVQRQILSRLSRLEKLILEDTAETG
jgi:hypothetical protein